MKANVTYWLDETAKRLPDKTAFADEKKEISFKELQRQAKAVASQIIAKKKEKYKKKNNQKT